MDHQHFHLTLDLDSLHRSDSDLCCSVNAPDVVTVLLTNQLALAEAVLDCHDLTVTVQSPSLVRIAQTSAAMASVQ